jgi:hypothetical protein
MPQLDFGIFFVEIFFNFLFFWFLYFFFLRQIFPRLNKAIKLRRYKLKKLNSQFTIFQKNFIFLNVFLQEQKIYVNNFLFNINFFSKLNIFYIISLNSIYSFLIKNNLNLLTLLTKYTISSNIFLNNN